MAALNEVLVSNARLDSIGFQLDSGAFSGRVHADGLMLATSTGSTAHSQSAGGPLGSINLLSRSHFRLDALGSYKSTITVISYARLT